MTNSTRSNDQTSAPTGPLDAFIARKMEIEAMLERLSALCDDHFDVLPDDVNWGHVGTLDHYAARLREISDSAFGEGEHAG
ncbi:hypothetical protein [Microbaculum marinum]|uniref:Uncharacterized protein n=1 Tax=Microbaculum marinum TaxID=1764581 RepID=A0AAW9RR67_9HYPH